MGPPNRNRSRSFYLGDEIKDQSFHVRGVIRNITTQPIEKTDAAIRLYSADGSLAETDFVRMNKETIARTETANSLFIRITTRNSEAIGGFQVSPG